MRLFYVDNQLLDLRANTLIAQTLQVYDPGKIGSVVTNYTSSIRAPRTFNNDQIFGFLGNSKTKSDIPYTSLECRYMENGLPIIRNGRVITTEVNEQDYNLQVFSGPWGFFEIIQDRTLWDLDFSDINGAWNQSDRDGYRSAVTGILQALVDDGRLDQDAASTAPTIENQGSLLKPPQIYYHTVLEKIFSTAGFEYEGDIFTNDIYKKMAMPLSVVYNDPAFLDDKMFFAAAPGTQVIVNPVAAVSVEFTENVKQGADNFYDEASEYVVTNTDTAAEYFRLIFVTDLTITVTGGTVDLQIEHTGTSPAVLLNKGSGTYTFSDTQFMQHNDVVKVTIINSSGTPTVTITSGQFYSTSATGTDGNEFFPSIVNGYVYFEKLFEEIKQIDFIKEFCVRFNCQITQINNVLQVNTLNYILDLRTGPDWTLKRDKGRERIKYSFSSYAQTNILKTPIDTEVTPDLTDSYGNGQFDLPNENIRDSFTIYTSLFYVSQMINTLGVFMLKLNLEPNVTNFARMPGKRLFFVREKYDDEPPVLYDAIDRTDYMVGYWFDPHETYEMSFQFFIDNFHQKYIDRCLRKIRLIEREYNLSDLDIYKFNQQVPIWDNSERFLVTKIINRVSKKVCKVELLKIDPNPENFFTAGVANEITGELVDAIEFVADTELAELSVEMELIETVTGNPTWETSFDNTQDTDVLSCPGNGFTDNGVLDHVGALSVNADVLKTFNDGNGPDGFPVDTGWVEWLKNGVQLHTETFNSSSHSNAQGLNYTYLNVVAFEVLKVIVHEDGTSP